MLDFYSSCFDTTEMDKPDTPDVLTEKVKEIMDASAIENAMETAALQSINVFYLLYVEPDNNDPDINCIYVS